ncbi:MAG: hypothetical protein IJF59_04820, partial [Clostridia bacterium]|nr:hypothetical protein [Clostridia bacterium]
MSAQTKRRLPLTVLTVLLSGLLAAAAMRLLLPSLLAEQPPQGYLTTTVTVDGLPADPPQPLLYADRETIYVNLQRLAPLVEGLTLERGEEAGEAVLRLSHRRYA